MLEAIGVWRQFPTEIESDLLDRGLDIGDWHEGTRDEHGRMKLSSRRLLVFTRYRGDASATKTAAREGDWTLDRHILAGVYNVADKLLEGYYAVHSTEDNPSTYEAFTFLSPAQQREADRKEREEEQQRQEDEQNFYADIGNGVS